MNEPKTQLTAEEFLVFWSLLLAYNSGKLPISIEGEYARVEAAIKGLNSKVQGFLNQ